MLLRILRLTALLSAVACVALGVQVPASAGEGNLVPERPTWVRAPADSGALPMVATDAAGGTGYVFSGTGGRLWDRAQAVSLPSGRLLSKPAAVPPLDMRSPLVVDQKRHIVLYVAALTSPINGTQQPAAGTIVGIGLRNGGVRVLFRYTSRLSPWQLIEALSLDDTGDDLIVLGTVDGSAYQQAPAGGPYVDVDRLSIDALVRNAPAPRWTSPYSLPPGPCRALLATKQPGGLLVAGSQLHFACGTPQSSATATSPVTVGQQPGVVALTGVTRAKAPSITATFYPTSGKIQPGESVADRRTRRLVLVTATSAGSVMRVFDSAHGRYVGTIKSPGLPWGATTDAGTGRLYFVAGGQGAQRALGHADLAAVVPTQGETQSDPWSGMLQPANTNTFERRIAFDTRSNRLLVPWLDTSGAKPVYAIAAVRDDLPRFAPVPDPDPDAGAVETVDRAGLTDSNRSASARAFGADYQLIGGATNIYMNGVGDNGGLLGPGSRYLRQAYVKQASLSSDGSTAVAVAAEEDSATDADRSSADLGSSFAPPALCSDFGTSPTKQPVVVVTAQVTCNLEKEQTHAAASYVSHDAVFIAGTKQSGPDVAPVQVGRSSADVVSRRDPDRGPLHTTVTATAESISILGTVRIGKVTSTVTVSSHGRRGTALASTPKVAVSGVSVGATPVCGASCSLDQVSAALNKALDGRGRVEFPQADVRRSRGGTTASVAQDPWYHAERVLDYDKSDDDFAMPAMTIITYLDGQAKSRLVVDLAGVTANASYRIFRLDRFTGGPGALSPGRAVTAAPVGALPIGAGPLAPAGAPTASVPTAAGQAPQQGLLAGISDALHLALRSPKAAIPLLFVWALLGLPEYLAARRRLLLELPMLTRETDVA